MGDTDDKKTNTKDSKVEDAIEMFVAGLVLDPSTGAPIVILRTEEGDAYLPIWIGTPEATAIATVLRGIKIGRPMTHDLMHSALIAVGYEVQKVIINDLRDYTYYAELVVGQGEKGISLDARPSDAIAIAVRASAPIFVNRRVLEVAQVKLRDKSHLLDKDDVVKCVPEDQIEQEKEREGGQEDPFEKDINRKDFNSIDKEKWAEILANLDPDDFKYKM